jgi:hypothetical protein
MLASRCHFGLLLLTALFAPTCGSSGGTQMPFTPSGSPAPPAAAPSPSPSPSPTPLPPGSSLTTALLSPPENHVFPPGGGSVRIVVAYAVNEEVFGDLWLISSLSPDGDNILRLPDSNQRLEAGIRLAQDLSGPVTLQGTATNPPAISSGPVESRFVINRLIVTRPGSLILRRILADEVVARHWTWQ